MVENIKKRMYIKVFYSMLDWEWFHEPNTFVVFMHLLLLANRKPQKYKGGIIDRGEVLASLEFLAESTGLSVRNVRTAVKHLKSTGEVTNKAIGKTTVYSIVNYDKYQSGDRKTDNEVTINRQITDNEVTTPIYCNNDIMRDYKSVCENEEKSTHTYGKHRNVYLTEKEYFSFTRSHPSDGQAIINQLSEKITLDPDKYKQKHSVWLDIFAENYKPPKIKKPEGTYTPQSTPPSFDVELAMRRSLELDPTQTKRRAL